MTRRRLRAALALVAILAGAALGGPRAYRWATAPPHGYCAVCRRQEHSDSVVRLRAEGEAEMEVCCLSCALSYGRQVSKPVTVTAVTDHDSGRQLDPGQALFVVGSDVSPCTHHTGPLRLEGESVPVHWDRCLPSVLAFATPETAEAFRHRHGGQVRSLQELEGQFARGETLH